MDAVLHTVPDDPWEAAEGRFHPEGILPVPRLPEGIGGLVPVHGELAIVPVGEGVNLRPMCWVDLQGPQGPEHPRRIQHVVRKGKPPVSPFLAQRHCWPRQRVDDAVRQEASPRPVAGCSTWLSASASNSTAQLVWCCRHRPAPVVEVWKLQTVHLT